MSPTQVDALKTEILELKGNLAALNQSVFDTFEQSLAASLQAPFRRIVEEQRDSADYIDLNGKRVNGAPRGRVLSAFEAVAKTWLHLYTGEEDVFELSFRLVQNHILCLNTDKTPVEGLDYRVKEITELLPWCLSRKRLPDSPEALPVPRKLSDFKLCTMMLASTMRHVLTRRIIIE